MSNEQLIAFTVLAALFVFAILQVMRVRSARRPISLDPDKYIVVDGSNVMHWGGEPSVLVLARVLAALVKAGLTPIVYFDANVGYKLWGRHANDAAISRKLGLDPRLVIVAPSGVTADELLLVAAVDNGLRVVTNDRFLDWRVQFPKAGKKGFLVKGEWRQGSVMLRGL